MLFVAAGGPNYEYTQILITELSIGTERIRGKAAAYAEGAPVSEAANYPEALIRIAFDDTPRDEAKMAVITGGDREHVGGGETDEHTAKIQENESV